jgi:cytochrome c556
MKLVTKLFVAVIVGAIVFGTAYAQFAKPEQAIRYRKSVMFLIVQHFGRMGAVIKGKAPYNKAEFERNAVAVETLSSLDWEAFQMPGSDKGDTRLSDAVFKQRSKFNETVKAFQNDTAKLADAARGGNFDTIKSQFGEVAKNCGSCHKAFRVK